MHNENNTLFIKFSSLFTKLSIILSMILFFLMLVFPFEYKITKIIFIIIILSYILLDMIKMEKTNIHKSVFIWVIIYIAFSVLAMGVSILKGNNGWSVGITTNIFWPILYMTFLSQIKSKKIIKIIMYILVSSCVFIGIYTLIYFLYINGDLSNKIFEYKLALPNFGGIHMGYIKYFMPNITTLLFVVPFVISLIIITNKENFILKPIILLDIALIFGLMLATFSVRTAFLMNLALAPIVTYVFCCIRNKKMVMKLRIPKLIKYSLLIVIVFSSLKFSLNIDLSKIINKIQYSFTGTGQTQLNTIDKNAKKDEFPVLVDDGSNIRKAQMIDLLKSWTEVPIFGSGNGANSKNIVRSKISGNYELTYFAMLYQRGLVGFLGYLLQIVWIYIYAIKIIKKKDMLSDYMLPVLVGFTCFLVANATNPYLQAYDHLWVLFLPIALINYNLLSEEVSLYE